MRKILSLLCVFGLFCVSLAQDKTAWSSLTGLHAGQKIEIVDTQSKKHSGTLVSASDTAISYRETTGDHSIEKQDVRSVKLLEHQRRPRHVTCHAPISQDVLARRSLPRREPVRLREIRGGWDRRRSDRSSCEGCCLHSQR